MPLFYIRSIRSDECSFATLKYLYNSCKWQNNWIMKFAGWQTLYEHARWTDYFSPWKWFNPQSHDQMWRVQLAGGHMISSKSNRTTLSHNAVVLAYRYNHCCKALHRHEVAHFWAVDLFKKLYMWLSVDHEYIKPSICQWTSFLHIDISFYGNLSCRTVSRSTVVLIGMWKVQNSCLYIRYLSSSQNNKAEECKKNLQITSICTIMWLDCNSSTCQENVSCQSSDSSEHLICDTESWIALMYTCSCDPRLNVYDNTCRL